MTTPFTDWQNCPVYSDNQSWEFPEPAKIKGTVANLESAAKSLANESRCLTSVERLNGVQEVEPAYCRFAARNSHSWPDRPKIIDPGKRLSRFEIRRRRDTDYPP